MIACAATLGIGGVQGAFSGGRAHDLLPDLRPAAPFEAEIRTSEAKDGTRYRLAFASVTENVGDGPLIIDASRPSRSHEHMTATQVIERSDGSLRRNPRVGTLRFDHERDHSHWHFLKFMVYELRRAGDLALVAPDRKSGFCLGDRHPITDRKIRGAAPAPRFTGECGKGKPGLRRVREGISVGWYDNYVAYLEGQYIDVTGVPDGRYVLVHRSDASREVLETTHSNNSSSSLIRLSTGGSGHRRVKILERCPAKPSCR